MSLYFEWIGSICGVLGALMISTNTPVSPWGWWFFLISSLSLCCYAVLAQAWFYENKKPGVDSGFLLLETCTTSITDCPTRDGCV
jgi:drug/metabolite transporter (DMT)-like permease